jgi:(5-formylfuran-3-yl)methyl phosphate synthase
VLLDTAIKDGVGLLQLLDEAQLRAWVRCVHAGRMFAALAGQLRAIDLTIVRSTGANIAGVRGAACDGDRYGCINAGKVRALSVHARDHSPSLSSTSDSRATPG